jgi:hypothetical protein
LEIPLSSNPPKTIAYISFAIALIFAVMIFIPESIGIGGFDGGFAISFVSIIIAVVAGIVGVMYLGYAGRLDKILRGEGILAHWTYTPEYWAQYTKKEYQEEISEKKGLFIIVSGFALFFGVLFWVLDNEAGFFVFLVMMLLIGLCLLAWRGSAWLNHRQNLNPVREAYITKDAIYLNHKFTTWRTLFTSFDGATINHTKTVSFLVFKYTSLNRTGAQTYSSRVPIPPDQKENAIIVMQQVNLQNGVPNTAPEQN